MADRPIIFSAPMVRAMLDGRKSQTRRIIGQPEAMQEWYQRPDSGRWLLTENVGAPWIISALPWLPGDRLWVREGFVRYHDLDDNDMRVGPLKTAYRADGNFRWLDADTDTFRDCPPWKPSIHMPRWASRLTLIVTEVRVQRLQEISEADAAAEGVTPIDEPNELRWEHYAPHGVAFRDLWNSLHGPEAWDANPWVAAITFTVHKANIDAMEVADARG
ncbi:hypothetical protein EYE35_01050 [Cereibacter sphaeroides]|nr:hypothetical protein EYE35_01050 [Cereibacter sphaeroides]